MGTAIHVLGVELLDSYAHCLDRMTFLILLEAIVTALKPLYIRIDRA